MHDAAEAKSSAREFLQGHYSSEDAAQIMRYAVDASRHRDVAICALCKEKLTGLDMPIHEGQLRRCDLVVDPWAWSMIGDNGCAYERWQQHFEEGPDSVRPLLGLPLHVLAPPLAALTDFEEMVLALVHPDTHHRGTCLRGAHL